MASIVVLGAGLNGLSTAMLLARDGHDVTVLERDPQPPADRCTPAAAGAAWDSWERRGVTQFRFLHLMLPRWCRIVERELPEVLDELAALGAPPLNVVANLPEEVSGGWRDGDEQFGTFAARRPVLETAFARCADAQPGVTVRRGAAVTGLLRRADGADSSIPEIDGVLTEGGEVVRADLVVDASGRRSPIVRWLEAAGCAAPAEERAEAGLVYYARYFRGRDGATPAAVAPLLQHHESVSILTLPADNDTWGVGFIAAASDRDLRPLREVERWEAALSLYPTAAHWADGDPLTPVEVIAGLEDRRRRFVVDGTPVATGVVVVGDAWACTNPSLGRGASIGLLHSCALRDIVREVGLAPADREALVRRFDEVTERDVTPYYEATAQFDRHHLAQLDADIAGRPYEPEDPTWAIAKAMEVSATRDPDSLRAWLRLVCVLALPDEVLGEPGVLERIIELGADGPRHPLPGASRRELLDVLGAGAPEPRPATGVILATRS